MAIRGFLVLLWLLCLGGESLLLAQSLPPLTEYNAGIDEGGTVSFPTPSGLGMQMTPSAPELVRLRSGTVDAVTGDINISINLGPRLPGRIKAGFTWNFSSSAGNPVYGAGLYPISWPSPELSNPQITMWVTGRRLQFIKESMPSGQGMPTLAKIGDWLRLRKVSESVISQLAAGATVFASADGTKFLAVSAATPTAMAVVDGEEAIWTANTLGDTRVTHISNIWGDDVTITEENFCWTWDATAPAPYPCAAGKVTIENVKCLDHKITLSMLNTGSYYCPFDFLITNSFGAPSVSTHGYLHLKQRKTFYKNGTRVDMYGNTVDTFGGEHLQSGDCVFIPNYFVFTGIDGREQKFDFSWQHDQAAVPRDYAPCGTHASGHDDMVDVYDFPLRSISYPDGLRESFDYSSAVSLSANSFDVLNSKWKGWGPSSPDNYGEPVSSNLIRSNGAISRVTFSGAGIGQCVVIARKWPKSIWNSQTKSRTWPQPKHETAILYFPTEAPDSETEYRGVHLVHPDGGSWVNAVDRQAYLFATSAVLRSEFIHGAGLPVVETSQPFGFLVPLSFLIYDTTVAENWELKSWGNPNGTLAVNIGLPINARATKISHFPVGLPATIKSESQWDAYGPTQTDEYRFDAIPAPALNSGSPAVWGAPAAVSGAPIHTMTKISRQWSESLGLMLKKGEESSMDGSRLPALRGVAAVNLGSTTTSYDSLGRPGLVTNVRGAFSTTETRAFEPGLPLVNEITRTVSDGVMSYPANPDNSSLRVGKIATYDTTPFRWLLSETDKIDGRPTTVVSRDEMGRPTQTQAPDGTITTTDYDAWGRVWHTKREARSDSNGTVGEVLTTFEYDVAKRTRTETVKAAGKSLTTVTTVDGFGRTIRVDLPGGKYQETGFDGFGQKVSQSPVMTGSQSGYGRARWEYDPQGRLTATFDAQGRPLTHVKMQPTCTSITKDGLTLTGVVTTVQDDQGFTRSTVTDLLGQKSAVVDQADHVSQYFYDKYGNLVLTSQGGQLRQYSYNDLGWLLSRTEPEEGTTTYGRFNLLGVPTRTSMTGRAGGASVNTSITLDGHLRPERVTTTALDNPAVDRRITYNDTFHVPISVTEAQAEGSITETYGIDAAGRLVSKTTTDGTETFVVSRTLDPLGNPLSLSYPAGGGKAAQTLTITSDSLFRPWELYLDGNIRAHMDYDLVDGTAVSTKLRLGNPIGPIMTTSRMDKGELTRVTHAAQPGENLFDMTWTQGGLMKSRGSDSFTYDALQRLTQATIHGLPGTPQAGRIVIQTFDYDRYGNRIRSTASVNTGTLGEVAPEVKLWSTSYPGTNELPATLVALESDGTTQIGNLPTGVQYDNLGRISTVFAIPGQTDSVVAWSYDAASRVVSENGSTFLLDPEGLRFRRKKSDGSVNYTVYGFNREPLSVFEKEAVSITTLRTAAATSPTKSLAKAGSSLLSATTLGGLGGSTLAVINSPQSEITVWTGQAIPFNGCDELRPGSTLTWDFGDGRQSVVTGPNVSHTFQTPGYYTVTLSAASPGCTPSDTSVNISVVARPTISLTATPTSLVNGESTTLSWTINGGTSSDTKTLSPAPGAVATTGNSIQRPAITTIYTQTVSNSYGSVSASVTVSVNNPPPPTISAFTAGNSNLNQGQSTALNWSVTGNANWPITLTLRTDAGSTSQSGTVTGSSLSVTPSSTTTYALTAENAFGRTTRQITVNVLPKPVLASFWAEPAVIRPGNSVTLKWQVLNVSSLSLSGVGSVTGGSITLTPSTTTQYTLTATNAAGSVTSRVVKVVVSTAPPVLVWKRSMVYGFGQLVCEETVEGVRYMQSDQVGTPNRVLDEDGNIIGLSKTLPFGERFGKVGYSSIRRYTNHEETNDYAIYMQARTYLPAYGKFAQVDPAYDQTKDDPETWNLYNYVTNNPVTKTDPNGMEEYLYIMSNATKRGGAEFTAGHSSLAKYDSTTGRTTTYGLWPDGHPGIIAMKLDNGKGSDVRTNFPGDKPGNYSYKFGVKLTSAQSAALSKAVGRSVEWAYLETCAKWAAQVFYETTGVLIPWREFLLFGTPRKVGDSIQDKDAKNPDAGVFPPKPEAPKEPSKTPDVKPPDPPADPSSSIPSAPSTPAPTPAPSPEPSPSPAVENP